MFSQGHEKRVGTLDISCTTQAHEVAIVWTERAGPPVVAPTLPLGFRSKIGVRSMSHQPGGSVAFDGLEEGVIVTMRMKRDRLAASFEHPAKSWDTMCP
jgi:two-component sensor histidine kinase